MAFDLTIQKTFKFYTFFPIKNGKSYPKISLLLVLLIIISPIIRKGTKGVILFILEEDKVFLVEFVDEKGDTIGNGMETVYIYQIIKYSK